MQQFPLEKLVEKQSRLKSEYNNNIKGNNIIIVGPSGCGKSTLISHLLGKQLNISCDNGKFDIHHDDAEFKIGNLSCTSETTKCTSKSMDNINIWDCPGFRATNGLNQDILTGFNLFYLMKYSDRYKIILVVCVDCFKAKRCQGFIEILNQLTQYFGTSVDQILQSVLIIVTKVPNKEVNLYRKQLQSTFQQMQTVNLQNQNGIQLSNESVKLLGSFIGDNHSEKVIVCAQPVQDQTNNTYNYQFDTNYLHNCIDKLTYCNTNNVKLSLDVQALSHIQLQFNDLKNQVSLVLQQLKQQIIQLHCNGRIKQQFNIIQNQDQQQNNNIHMSRYEIRLNALKQIFANNQNDIIIQQCAELHNLVNQINFIQDNILSLESLPYEIDDKILNSLVNDAWSQILEYFNNESQQTGTELCICGNIISLSDILAELSQYQQSSIDNIYVYCIDSILLDKSIQLNGINLTINAQKWLMTDIPIIIDLSGKDGSIHEQSKATNGQGYDAQGNGNSGSDGLNGKHGQDGGHFTGIGKEYDDLKQLTINTSGGKGSNGQDGGDGSNGQDGDTNGEQFVRNRDRSALTQRSRQKWIENRSISRMVFEDLLTLNEKRIETYIFRGSDGKQGGNSGLPGKGGISGKPGQIQLKEYQQNNYISKQILHPNGSDGKAGQVGQGGKQYQWFGQYQNEICLPVKRVSQEYVNYVETNKSETISIKMDRVTFIFATQGLGLILQGIGSMVSAQVNSYWTVKPYLSVIEHAPIGQVNVISNQYETPQVPNNSVSQLNYELFDQYTLNNIKGIQEQDNIISKFIKNRVQLESRQ